MKGLVLLVLATSILVISPVRAVTQTREYWKGGEGWFQYPFSDEAGSVDFIVWKKPPGSDPRFGSVDGTITEQTRLSVVNKEGVSRRNLELLTDKKVVVIGRFQDRGRGEGTKTRCLSLIILVLPNDR